LIHADATNNKNNHTFIDSSSNNVTITRNGNATQGTFSPFSQTGWSNSFDGTGDYLTLSSNTALSLSTGDFTLEFWVYFNSVSADSGFVGSTGTGGYDFLWRTSTGLNIGRVNTAFDNTFAWSPTVGKWYHVAYCRSGTSLRAFIDGTQIGTTATNSTAYNSATTVVIGGSSTSDRLLNGYISNLRMLKGTASYTANFTPPTAALTAISNTSLLTCQSNQFIDNSSNNFSITRSGDVSVQPFSPFAPTAAYSTTNVGGSVYLDGTGDSLSWSGSTIGTNPYTLEAWVYFNAIASDNYLLDKPSDYGNLAVRLRSSSVMLEAHNVNSPSFQVPTWVTKQWYHVAVVRNSSNQTTAWVNGVRSNTGVQTITNNYGISSTIGTNLNGYISGFNLNIGSALYDVNSSTISIPTSPPTSTSNTRLLLNYTNAGIFDQTAKNVIETVGDAKISTAQYKYGNSSMLFDGTGDYLKVISGGYPTLANFTKSGYAGTIEMWVYVTSMPSVRSHLVGFWASSSGWTIDFDPSGDLFFSSDGAGNTVTLSSKITTGSWMHLAFVNTGSIINIYKNGTNVGTRANYSPGTPSTNLLVGLRSDGAAGFIGYIDDLRITQGYARYTSNFTAPTAAFKDN
jgi:hypothetical protein